MSEYTYQNSSVNGGVDTNRLFNEIISAGYQVSGVWFNQDGTIVTIQSDSTQEQIDSVVSNHEGPDSLSRYKAIKYAAIDLRTDQLIASGFTYSGKIFSLSAMAQTKVMGTHQVKDDPLMTYPIRWNTIDDNDYYEITDADDLHAFYLTCLGTYRTHVDAGTALKDQVREATSKDEVNELIDSRY